MRLPVLVDIAFVVVVVLACVSLDVERLPAATAAPPADSKARPTPSLRIRLEPDSTLLKRYRDPVGGGVIPLIAVNGRRSDSLSRHFTIGDLVPEDADFARISPALVHGLEMMMWLAEVPIHVSSGYRHPAYNADPSVGGAPDSQHQAGRAADIWSTEKSPGELAEIALDVMECRIGIGLGRTFLHIDLRGHLASWTTDDAPLDEATFDAWVEARCNPDDSSTGHAPSFAVAVAAAAEAHTAARLARRDSLLQQYRDELTTFARVHKRKGLAGSVVLDLRPHADTSGTAIPYRLSFVSTENPLYHAWGIDALMQAIDAEAYFVFAVLDSADTPTLGAMPFEDP